MQTPRGSAATPTSHSSELTSLSLEGPAAAPGHRIPAPPPSQKQPGRWVPPGESVAIAGVTLPDGMVYVGTQLSAQKCAVEPALINPFMRVAHSEYDSSFFDAVGRPTYSILSPQNKKAYLRWLSRGRKTPDTHVSYVFLFFYGLERRVLFDEGAEIRAIREEVQRLLSIYGGHRTFAQVATRFIGVLNALLAPAGSYLAPCIADIASAQDPFLFNYALGQLARDGYPLSPEMALAWCHPHPYVTLTRVAERFPAKFGELFKRRYRQTFGDGLVLFPNPTQLVLRYAAASPGCSGELPVRLPPVPDVRAVMNHAHKLQGLVNGCSVLLEPYVQLYTRTVGEVTFLDELLHLPPDIWSDALLRGLEDLRARLHPDEPLVMTLGALLETLGSKVALSRSAARKLGEGLAAAGISLYQDLRGNAKAPGPDERVALFPLQPEGAAIGPGFQAAEAVADALRFEDLLAGEVPEASLNRYLMKSTHSASDRLRLTARARILGEQRSNPAALKKVAAGLTPRAARAAGQCLAYLVASHTAPTPAQIKALEKAYKALDLDPQWAYSDLHTGAVPDLARTEEAPDASQTELVLDTSRIARLQAETAEVSVLLADVFSETDMPPAAQLASPAVPADPAHPEPLVVGGTRVWSLDAPHSALARLVASRERWGRAELATECASLDLMLEGALEAINEAAFDAMNEPLTEGDDPIEVNAEVGAVVATHA